MASLSTFGKDEKCYGGGKKKNPSDFFSLCGAEGSEPHWPWESHHVARDEEHVTHFLPNPSLCWKGGRAHC